jgi:cell division protein FtsA
VCTLIADVSSGVPEILGAGICPSQGLRKGVVVDVQAAVDAIAGSLQRAEQQSGFKAMSALVGIAGAHILSTNSHAIVAVRHPDSVISQEDVARVIDGAQIIQLPADQEIVHVIPRHFVVDGMDGIKDPVGMVGRRLEIEANIVTGSMTSIHNVARCLEAAEVELDAFILDPLAAGWAVLSAEERELGSMVVDIGGGTTDAAIFRDGSLLHTYILPVGGNQISNDLAFALRATFPVAEELKIRSGTTISHAPSNGDVIAVPAHGRDEPQPIEQRLVAEIIDARLAETFELVREQMMQAGFGDAYPGGVVLTGGSAQIPGTAALASEIFGTPARIGVPQRLRGLADAVRGPAFSTSVGILLWGQTQLTSASEPHGSKGLSALGASLKAWVQNFFG